MTKHYELTYTISKNLTPEEAGALFDKIISYLPQATVSEKGYNFATLEFYTEPNTIAELDKKLKSEPQIKKYLIVKKEVVKASRTRIRKVKIPTSASEPQQKEQKVEKVELKEIDKKLKEIFGE